MKLPHKVSYTHSVKAGDAHLWNIRINPKYKDDAGLYAHEYEHIKQWYKSVLLLGIILLGLAVIFSADLLYVAPVIVPVHGVLYRFSSAYRAYCEAEAFKAQLKHYPEQIDFFAEFLAGNYDLGITVAEAKTLLSR